jgi:hypothetical protein
MFRVIHLGTILDQQILQERLFLLPSGPTYGHVTHQPNTVFGAIQRIRFAFWCLVANEGEEVGGSGHETTLKGCWRAKAQVVETMPSLKQVHDMGGGAITMLHVRSQSR